MTYGFVLFSELFLLFVVFATAGLGLLCLGGLGAGRKVLGLLLLFESDKFTGSV